MRTRSVVLAILAVGTVSACADRQQAAQPSGGTWLPADGAARDSAIERQFRGFDMAMVETGYRYAELYWAGLDQNWAYAAYHAEKIRTAIANGLERRPARAASAQPFLNEVLPLVMRAIDARDSAAFAESFGVLTGACNSCHAAEQMEFVDVRAPAVRSVPVGG